MSRPAPFVGAGKIVAEDGFLSIETIYLNPETNERSLGRRRITDKDFQLWDKTCLGRGSTIAVALSPTLFDRSEITVTWVAAVFVLTRNVQGLDPRLPVVGGNNMYTVCYQHEGDLAETWRASQSQNQLDN